MRYACIRTSKGWNFPSICIETKPWQKHSSQKNPFKIFLQKILPKKNLSKKFRQKNPQKKSKKNPKNFSKIPNFENIQFPTSHLEAENPFGLAFPMGIFFGSLLHILSWNKENLLLKYGILSSQLKSYIESGNLTKKFVIFFPRATFLVTSYILTSFYFQVHPSTMILQF